MLQKVQEAPEPISDEELYDLDPERIPEVPFQAAPPPAPWEWRQPIQGPDPVPPQPPMPGGPPRKTTNEAGRVEAQHKASEAGLVRAETLSAALDILSFRLILLLCVVASSFLFGAAALWPDQWRLASAVAFSIIVTGPCMYFYRKA